MDKVVPIDKALFVLDLVGVGRRIYTQLRQSLIAESIIFPSYSKVVDVRNILISRPSIHLYPDTIQPIGVYTSYFLQVQKTLERILSTINLPASEEFTLTFRIADCLDGCGCLNIYNLQHTNTNTKNFILFVLSRSPSTQNRSRLFGEITLPILHSLRDPFFSVLRRNVKIISRNLWKI